MSDLREQLTERMHQTYWAEILKLTGLSPATERASDSATLAGYLAQADECIRQMEWARRSGIKLGLVCRGTMQGIVTESASGAERIGGIKRPDLTLAPEDWKP